MNNNQFYIEKYKNTDQIITKYYRKDGIELKGVINPLDIDLRSICAPTDQQDNKPHCSAYSICGIFESIYWKMTGKLINLDADQVYAKAKELDPFINSPGISLDQAIKSCWKLCGFEEEPQISILKKDSIDVVEQIKFLVHKYGLIHMGLNITNEWYNCINKDKWYDFITSPKYRIVENGDFCGLHAVICCGYNPDGIIIQNSWGKDFGNKGFCLLSYKEFIREFQYCCYIENIYKNFNQKNGVNN